MQRLSSRLAASVRQTAKVFLMHTYDWLNDNSVPVLNGSDPTYDSHGNQIFTDPTTITDKLCLFFYEDIPTSSGTLLHTPTLYCLYNDPIDVKDIVLNVTSADGSVLLESGIVEALENTNNVGNGVLKVVRLSGATTVG